MCGGGAGMTKNITCVICPSGCNIVVEGKGTDISSVKGNRCPRGKEYAINEFKCPVRTLTSSVAVRHGEQPVFSVRTTGPVPKDKIKAVSYTHLTLPTIA